MRAQQHDPELGTAFEAYVLVQTEPGKADRLVLKARMVPRSVTWLPEEERPELRLVLPQPDEEAAAAGARVDSVRARGWTLTESTHTDPVIELLVRVPWS